MQQIGIDCIIHKKTQSYISLAHIVEQKGVSMMTNLRKISCILLAGLMTIGSTEVSATGDNSSESQTTQTVALTVSDGRLSEDTALQAKLDAYFAYREQVLSGAAVAMSNNNLAMATQVTTDLSSLQLAHEMMETRMDVTFEEVESDMLLLAATKDSTGDTEIMAYEWVGISYDTGYGVDYMGYGMEHIFTVTEDDNGSYVIADDMYHNEDLLGGTSTSYDVEKWEDFSVYQEAKNTFRTEQIVSATEMEVEMEVASTNTSTTYNPQAAVEYAYQYCGISATQQAAAGGGPIYGGGQNPTYYNTAQYETESADCANFVSQCLVAGGLGTNNTWKPKSTAWVRASALRDYLVSTPRNYLECIVEYDETAGTSNVYPGNPVYWINNGGSSSGHQMICVGKNSAGVPVVCAHNSDIYRYPITEYMIDGRILKTIHITTSYQHSTPAYEYNSSKHWFFCMHCWAEEEDSHSYTWTRTETTHTMHCSLCSYAAINANHTAGSVVAVGSTGHFTLCSGCGYQMTETMPHMRGAMQYNATNHWQKCTSCSYYFVTETAHNINSTYSYNESSHWQTCSGCDYKKNMTQHNYILSGTTKTCRFCGYTTTNDNTTPVNLKLLPTRVE